MTMNIIIRILGNMFRRIIPAAAAAIALHLSACTETLVVYDDSEAEIGLAPVSRKATKLLSGSQEGPDYDYMESFGVFAWHKITPAGQNWTEFYDAKGELVPYISNTSSDEDAKGEFICIDKDTDQKTGTTWAGGSSTASVKYDKNQDADQQYVNKGQPDIRIDSKGEDKRHPYYWPKTGSLIFAGYSPYDITDQNGVSVSYDTHRDRPGIRISGISQGDFEYGPDNHWATNGTFDLMWFDVDDATSFSAQASAIPVTFKHACAWLDFRITAEAGYENMFSLYQAILTNVWWKGNFDSSAEEHSEWTGLEDLRTEVIMFDHDGEPSPNNPNDDEFVKIDAGGFHLGNMIVIPQALDGKGQDQTSTTQLVLRFRQHTSDGKPLIQEKVFDLEGITENGRWEIGKHYIYDITFTLHKIYIDPTVVKWEERPGTVSGESI